MEMLALTLAGQVQVQDPTRIGDWKTKNKPIIKYQEKKTRNQMIKIQLKNCAIQPQ